MWHLHQRGAFARPTEYVAAAVIRLIGGCARVAIGVLGTAAVGSWSELVRAARCVSAFSSAVMRVARSAPFAAMPCGAWKVTLRLWMADMTAVRSGADPGSTVIGQLGGLRGCVRPAGVSNDKDVVRAGRGGSGI